MKLLNHRCNTLHVAWIIYTGSDSKIKITRFDSHLLIIHVTFTARANLKFKAILSNKKLITHSKFNVGWRLCECCTKPLVFKYF